MENECICLDIEVVEGGVMDFGFEGGAGILDPPRASTVEVLAQNRFQSAIVLKVPRRSRR